MYTRVTSCPLFKAARSCRSKLFAAKLCVAKGAVGDEKPIPGSRGAQHHAGPVRVHPLKRASTEPGAEPLLGKSSGHWMRHRRSKGRSKSRASSVDGRRLGPGKVTPRHGGGAEAVSAGLTESALRAPRKRHAPVSSEDRDRGVRSSVGYVPGSELTRPQVRRRFASAIARVVKTRRSPVFVGGTPRSARPTKSR